MKKYFSLIVVITITILFTSCDSLKAKFQIRELKSLIEHVEKNGADFDRKDWNNAFDEYEQILDNMDNYTYTREQREEISKLKGEFYSVAMKNGFKSAGKMFENALNEAGSFFEGLVEGLEENQEEIMESVEDIYDDATDAIEEAVDNIDLEDYESLFE